MIGSVHSFGKKVFTKLNYIATTLALAGVATSLIASFAAPNQASLVGAYGGQAAGTAGHRLSQSQSRFNSTLPLSGTFNTNPAIAFSNWSGYAATSTKPFNEAQTIYIQPTSTCTTTGAWTLFWTGLDGFNNATAEQVGTSAECLGTSLQPIYYAWWEMYPTNTVQMMPIAIHPGDVIQATVNYNTSNDVYSLSVSDMSDGQAFNEQTICAANLVCARSSAEWIVERPILGGSYTALADWGTMTLTGNEASNSTKTTYSGRGRHATVTTSNVLQPVNNFSNTPINMINYPYTGSTIASVGQLDQTGTQFNDTWQAAQ